MKKKKYLPLPRVLKKTEQMFNAWVRKRDSEDGWFVCINCGIAKSIDVMQAGHLVPVKKSSALRFNPDNVNGECQGCNGYDDAKVTYTLNLIRKIGLERVNTLIAQKRAGKKWSREELLDIQKKTNNNE